MRVSVNRPRPGFPLLNDTGPGGYDGIRINSTIDNVEIRNGALKHFLFGVDAYEGGFGHRLFHLDVTENTLGGIELFSKGNLVVFCSASGNKIGIDCSSGVTLKENTCFDNTECGIRVEFGATINRNICRSNKNGTDQGIGIHAGLGSTVINNICSGNDTGLKTGTGCSIAGNTAYINSVSGISVGGYGPADQNTAYLNGTNLIITGRDVELGAKNPW